MRRIALLLLVVFNVAACGATAETAAPPSATAAPPASLAATSPASVAASPSPTVPLPSPSPTVPPSPSPSPTATATPQPTVPATPTTVPTVAPTAFPSATGGAPSPSPTAAPTRFGSVLELIPRGTRSFGYTDWTRIKAAAGVPNLSSRSTMEERVAFLLTIGPKHASGSSFGLTEFRRLADTWGFDSTDYAWELTIDLEDMAPVHYLQFPPGFDLGPTIALFAKRGFSEDVRFGATVYSHPIDSTTDWLLTLLATTNVAVRPGETSLILSASPEALDRVLAVVDNIASALADDPVNSRLAELGEPEAAVVLPAPDACEVLADEAPRPVTSTAPWPGGRYEALAITYLARPDGAHGRIVFLYATPEAAANDLAFRAEAARDGRSGRAGRPYADYAFTVERAELMGSSVVLDVRPGEGAPIRLFQMFWARDMTFAVCSAS